MGLQDRSYYRESYDTQYRPMADFSRYSMVTILIAINVVIWLLDAFTPPASEGGLRLLARHMASESTMVTQPWMWWKLLSAGFAHASVGTSSGFTHILFNMLTLFFFGNAIERRLGRWEFLRFYLLAILFASVVSVGINFLRGLDALALGASGGVTAVLALFIFCYPRQKVYLFMMLPIPAWILGVFMVVSDMMHSLDSTSHIGGEAHLAGFAFGAAYFWFKWNFGALGFGWLNDRLQRKPRLKVHQPSAREARLIADGDRILEKIHQQGEESLTSSERRTLKKYSQLMQKK